MNRLHARSGRVLLPWLFILVMICSLFWLLNRIGVGRQHINGSHANLKAVYQALQTYEAEHGVLPHFAMYPEDAEVDPDSPLRVLSQYGLRPDQLICPSAPQVIRQAGISYLWNPAVNGTSLKEREEDTWLMVDIQALDDELPGPHFGSYMILYTDGDVERSRLPPRTLPVQYGSVGNSP